MECHHAPLIKSKLNRPQCNNLKVCCFQNFSLLDKVDKIPSNHFKTRQIQLKEFDFRLAALLNLKM